MSSPAVLLAIPAYNCAPQIVRVLEAIDDDLMNRLAAVVVVDNCSTDDTVERASAAGRHLGERFEVWRNTANYGLGGTHKVVFDHAVNARYEYVAVLHGDDQARAKELHSLLDRAIAQPKASAVLGSRFIRGSGRVGYSRTRTLGNVAINAVFTLVALRRTADLGSGLNLFRVSDLEDEAYRAFDDRITFNIDLLLHFFSRRAVLAYVPITWTEADQVSNARNVAVGSAALRKLVRWRLGRAEMTTAHARGTFEVMS